MKPVTPTLILTRPAEKSRAVLGAVEARLGRQVPAILSPIIDIVPTGASVDFAGIGGLILTSENAGLVLKDADLPKGLRAYCVGDSTAKAAAKLGLDAKSASGTANDLLTLIVADPPRGPLLHLRGRHVTGDLVGALASRGIPASEVICYDQIARPLTAEAKAAVLERATVVPLYSPRSAALVREGLGGFASQARVIAISAATARAWGASSGMRIADRPDADAMLDAIVDEMSRDSAC